MYIKIKLKSIYNPTNHFHDLIDESETVPFEFKLRILNIVLIVIVDFIDIELLSNKFKALI